MESRSGHVKVMGPVGLGTRDVVTAPEMLDTTQTEGLLTSSRRLVHGTPVLRSRRPASPPASWVRAAELNSGWARGASAG